MLPKSRSQRILYGLSHPSIIVARKNIYLAATPLKLLCYTKTKDQHIFTCARPKCLFFGLLEPLAVKTLSC